MGNIIFYASSCKCWVLVSGVQLVAVLSAMFCAICSLLVFMVDASDGHFVETYRILVLLWLSIM